MTDLHLDIEGMHCANCVRNVQRALEKADGVTVSRVSIGAADVKFDSSKTSADQVAAVVTDAGYPAKAA